MIRQALVHLLHAAANRLDVEREVEIQYVYIYSAPPVQPQPYQQPWWQGPWTTTTPNTIIN